MKKMLLALSILFLLMAMPAFAADLNTSKSLTFQWEQPTPADLAYLQGWNFYSGDSAAGPWVKFASVPYVAGSGPTFTTDATLTVTGVPGATVKKYFAATAVNKDGLESTFATGQPAAQEVTASFLLPYPLLDGPFNLKVIVNLVPK